MIKYPGKFKKTLFLSGIITILCIFTFQAYQVLAEPGSYDDPVITLSYLKEVFMPSIRQELDAKIKNVKSSGGDSFSVVNIKPGQRLIGNAGTELILRMGEATIISTEKGGLADTTQGEDLHNGVHMPSNHLLIIPMDDGRGLIANTEVLVMVKGGYNIN